MDWLRPVWDFFVRHVYVVVFVTGFVDATGLPFPGRLLLIAAGALAGGAVAASATPTLVGIIALGAAGSILGDQIWYLAGRRGGDRMLDVVCRATLRSSRRCRDGARHYYDRFGAATIVIGRFSAVVRIFATALAASSGLPYARFLVYDVVGAVVWTALWVLGGYVVGDHWQSLADRVGQILLIATALVLVALATLVITRLRRNTPAPSR